jgi:hypothetical protein
VGFDAGRHFLSPHKTPPKQSIYSNVIVAQIKQKMHLCNDVSSFIGNQSHYRVPGISSST